MRGEGRVMERGGSDAMGRDRCNGDGEMERDGGGRGGRDGE